VSHTESHTEDEPDDRVSFQAWEQNDLDDAECELCERPAVGVVVIPNDVGLFHCQPCADQIVGARVGFYHPADVNGLSGALCTDCLWCGEGSWNHNPDNSCQES